MKAFFDEIATRQAFLLNQHLGPRDKKPRLIDVKEMLVQVRGSSVNRCATSTASPPTKPGSSRHCAWSIAKEDRMPAQVLFLAGSVGDLEHFLCATVNRSIAMPTDVFLNLTAALGAGTGVTASSFGGRRSIRDFDVSIPTKVSV